MGASELFVVAFILAVFVYPTVYGAYRAFTTGRRGWGVGILVGWLVGMGWIVGIVFLLGPNRRHPGPNRLTT